MSLLTSLQVGARGLAAASAAIAVTTTNVAGAGVEGYARRRVDLRSMDPVRQHGLWVGQGVALVGIHRAGDRLLAQRVASASGDAAYASGLESALSVAEAYVGMTGSTGLPESLDAWFDALGAAAADPSDVGLREEVLAATTRLADVVSTAASGLEATLDGYGEEVEQGLAGVNETLAELASLNAAIAESGGAADYLDRRDQLLGSLTESIGVDVELAADGQVTVYVGGHAVVSGSQSRTLSVETAADGSATVGLSFGSTTIDVTAAIGGATGAVLQASETVRGYLDTLDTFAFAFANAVNAQHAAGFDATGAAGGAVFTVASTTDGAAASLRIDPTLAADPDRLAFAGSATATAGDGDNLALLLALEDDTATLGGDTPHDWLSGLVTEVGNDVASAASASESATALLTDLQGALDGITAVNLDDEAVRLIEYQAAYSAASSVISTVDQMLQDLLDLKR